MVKLCGWPHQLIYLKIRKKKFYYFMCIPNISSLESSFLALNECLGTDKEKLDVFVLEDVPGFLLIIFLIDLP